MRLALWMYQGTAHHGVGRIANSMRGVHAVFHAPQGDDYVNPIFTMLERTPFSSAHSMKPRAAFIAWCRLCLCCKQWR
jgi:hypothetical protein